MNTTPCPSVMPKFKVPTKLAPTAIVANLVEEAPAKIVRPGMRDAVVESLHDGIVKAKHLREGQAVRAWLHGGPKGGERVVKSVTRSEDGATVTVEFSSPHPTTEYKAAYRWFDASLEGTPVRHVTKVPALVAYEEV